ncbi:uncharacterized protein PAC_03458 [Phialocephala subalpina]|uniref:Uncharacterized protein n=1 Tax=Phialocephala subalpina TaxID=576137 RepID=A0A1L7WLC5_9HELO|nr:uncharacterized protein PAC_03458 [Phialocephala subalpina]
MATSTSETTPLLGETAPAIENNDQSPVAPTGTENEAPLPASAHFRRPRKILSIIILVAALITSILLIASHYMIYHGHFNYYFWDLVAAIEALGFFWNFPVILNIVLDFFLPLCIIPWATNMYITWPNDDWCIKHYYDRKKPPVDMGPACHAMLLAVEILLGIAAGLAFIVGVSHLILLVLRSVALWRTKFWTRPLPLANFPTGQVTFEVSIKVLRQERGEVRGVVAN